MRGGPRFDLSQAPRPDTAHRTQAPGPSHTKSLLIEDFYGRCGLCVCFPPTPDAFQRPDFTAKLDFLAWHLLLIFPCRGRNYTPQACVSDRPGSSADLQSLKSRGLSHRRCAAAHSVPKHVPPRPWLASPVSGPELNFQTFLAVPSDMGD